MNKEKLIKKYLEENCKKLGPYVLDSNSIKIEKLKDN